MDKVKMKILALSYSLTNSASYIVILTEGERKLPIVVKPQDAGYISMKMEKIQTIMPTTYDVIKNITENTGVSLTEIVIHNLIDGMFYTKLVFGGEKEFSVDCSIGDAISMSLIYKLPLYVNCEILEKSGVYMNDDGTINEDQVKKNMAPRKRKITVDQLQKQLAASLEMEDYEKASLLRDKIESLKKKKSQKNKD